MAFFETLIGGLVTTTGNHRCMLPEGEGAQGPGSIPLNHEGASCAGGKHHRHWSGTP
jgi:hypothetical protein